MAHPVQQLRRSPLLALIDALGDPRQLFADIVHRVGGPVLGAGDPLGQPFGDAGDFRTQLFQRLGLAAVRAPQPLFDRAAHTREFCADLVDSLGAAMFGRLELLVEGVGHLEDLLTHSFERVRGFVFRSLYMGRHITQVPLQTLHTFVGRSFNLVGEFLAHQFDPLRQFAGQLLHAPAGRRLLLQQGLRAAKAAVQAREGAFQAANGLGGAGLGLFQPLGDARDNRVHQNLRTHFPREGFLGDLVQVAAQDADGLPRPGLSLVELSGDFVQRGLSARMASAERPVASCSMRCRRSAIRA